MSAGSEPKIWIGERVLVRPDPQVAERALVAVVDAGEGDHLRADEPGTEAAALPAERLHADAGHRGENDARGHLDGADPPGNGDRAAWAKG